MKSDWRQILFPFLKHEANDKDIYSNGIGFFRQRIEFPIYIYIEGEAFQIDWIFFRLCFIYILSFLRHYVSPDNKMEFTSFPIFFFLKTRIFSEFHLYIFSKWFLSGEIEKIFSRVSNVRETNFIMKFEVNWEIK